jgi:rfaE bifunctional protein nucleotidyltransferase chain/domain
MKVVLCHGCFDVLHLGHIRHLQEARKLGDKLIVSLTTDRHVNKGPGRPYFSADQRREQLLALKCVDDVVFSDSHSAEEIIERIKPAFYVKGPDYAEFKDPTLIKEMGAVYRNGGAIVTTDAEKWSSTDLLRAFRLSEEAIAYVDTVKRRGYRDQILRGLEEVDKHEVNFVGETIIDKYKYVRALGKPAKEFILAVDFVREVSFEGGVIAASKHGEWKRVNVITSDVINAKTRYVDVDSNRKIFEVYNQSDIDGQWDFFRNRLCGASDFMVIVDFGHGVIENAELDILRNKDSLLIAATAQNNAGNFGYNSIKKYSGIADYICLDQPEARMAAKMRDDPIKDVVRMLRGVASKVVVTSGPHGAVSYDGTYYGSIPAFASGGVDTMGAGDAFLAVSGPLVLADVPLEIAAFAGNVAGAIKVNILGHERHVTRQDLVKQIDWLLA